MAKQLSLRRAHRARVDSFALTTTLLLTVAGQAAAGSAAPGLFQPATAVFITYDNSASMDFTTEFGVVPAYPETCQPDVEYARTRHVLGLEALTGSLQGYCPIEESRSDTAGTRDDADTAIPHTRPQFDWQRRDGILDVYSDAVFFGLGTFDAQPDASNDETGDFSWGFTYPGDSQPINLGLASSEAPMGGLVSPLPPGWLPDWPGAVRSFRVHNNARIQDTLLNVVPGGGTPIAAAIDDVQQLVNLGPGVLSDPFAGCRDVVHVLVTDGDPLWDLCHTNAAAADGWMACADYLASYEHSQSETSNLTLGEHCDACSAETTPRQVPTYVVAFAVDDATAADDIAVEGGTCALLDEDGSTCLENSFEADYTGELAFALGTVFNQFVEGRLSMVPPVTSTVAFDEDLGVVRFRAGTVVSQTSPYWTGELTRQLFSCVAPQIDEPEELTPTDTLLIHQEVYQPEAIGERNIYTARLDIAAEGFSCDRPDCAIGDTDCHAADAVPDPAAGSGHGDGTGGMDSGGANDDASVLPPEPALVCANVDEAVGAQYLACETACDNDADCLCECETFFGCGDCGYVATAPVCPPLGISACELLCPVLGIDDDACQCHCEDLFSCGACWDGLPDTISADATTREEVDEALSAARSVASAAGNDTPLPVPPATVPFDQLEVTEDSCLIPFDVATFVTEQDLTSALFVANDVEAKRTIAFTRGANLSALRDEGLLDGLFDPDILELHDRVEAGFVGDFLHTRMALLGRPSRLQRTTTGYLEFVDRHGERPYTLFAGANDGMLHAYDAISGEELWAIIPPSFLPELSRMVFSHRLSVDGAIVARDLRCGRRVEDDLVIEEWCSLAAVSYRGGGSGAMVLEVSDPTAPRFLFEVTGRDIPELGLGYPTPLLGNMFISRNDAEGQVRPVLVLAGGRPLDGPETPIGDRIVGSHEGEVLAVLDALTGEIFRQLDPVSHPDLFAQCGPVSGSPTGWSPELFTRVMVGTANGCLLRLDTSDEDPARWELEILYQVASRGEITFAPAIAPRPDGTLVAVFGTGNPDEFEHVNQHGSFVSVNENRLLLAGDDADLDTFVLDDVTANWEIALAPGEMLTTAPLIADGVVFAGSWVPASDACDGGSSQVYTVDYVGDPSVDGPDSSNPTLVSIDSDRIVGRFANPFFDPDDVSSEPFLKFLDGSHLGDNTVVFGVSIESLPTCLPLDAIPGVAVEPNLLATPVTRQLLIDLVGDLAEEEEEESEPTAEIDDEIPTEVGIISIEHDVPQPRMAAVPLDWGVVLEF